ncbi:RIP metalloprotease RseP [Reinekea marina]|uniref:Zinc metalloprotease n=1 Tax=Reinekea marina TaxID=1310421 RepID=A0ABV7WN98_9GAMM|nr:RIP metalloprotease RseP [Reinekea marina]MDN3649958.1 RIP metalloprotease RseP [Reinekea marina]
MFNSVFGLIIALGILVTIHEYGHFWVARRNGVKVLRFSVGFGQPIWRKIDKHGTEFVVAWIPLGGYVKMLDEREGDVPENLKDQAFNTKRPGQKIAIALAGPVANFLFAIVAFALMFMIGVRDVATIVGEPIAGSVAQEAGLQANDRIIAVDGEAVDGFSELSLALASRVGESGQIELQVDRKGQIQPVSLPIQRWLASEQSPRMARSLGITPLYPSQPAIIGGLLEGGAAQRDGLLAKDKVTQVNGVDIEDWSQWVNIIQSSPEQTLTVGIIRNGGTQQLLLTPDAREVEGEVQGYIGAAAAPVAWPEEQLIVNRYMPWTALYKGALETKNMVSLSLGMLWKMVSGQISLKQIGGPIAMAQMAGTSVESGFEAFIAFLALISISLGIMNLLPVPILDGGHVIMHALEAVRKKELSERAQMISMQIGLMLLISLMALAFFNDIGRLM